MVRKVKSEKVVEPEKVDKSGTAGSDVENLVEEVEEKLEVQPKPEKKKRAPSAYNLFVKEQMSKMKDVPPKERFSKISELWKKHKAKMAKASKKKK